MDTESSASERRIAWMLVALQALLIGLVVLLPRRPAWDEMSWVTAAAWSAIGIAVLVGGWGAVRLGSGLTPLPLPNGQTALVTAGPYRWVRHPIYSAVALGVLGIAIRSRTPLVIAAAVALTLFFTFKARWEEAHLRRSFPGYDEYAATTGRFVPGVGRVR